MKTYICNNCGQINKITDYNENTVCSYCKAKSDRLELIENQIAENEIDAIINSVIENLSEEKEEKIINKTENEDNKSIEIDENNPCVKKNKEKCINCGQCKKTCEKFANLRYDLNKCSKPICIGCGECIKNCPAKAIVQKENYIEVKEIIDKNEKIVIAIIEPNVSMILASYFNIDAENIDLKINDALNKIGFDYAFNSGFACDINIIEEVSEFVDRLRKKKSLPLITANCPSLVKYLEIYHPELIDNISTCKNPISIQNEVIKNLFCAKKGFSKEKIITVGITTCLSKIMSNAETKDGLDYILTVNELIKIIEREQINMSNLLERPYENFENYSTSSKLLDLSGGQSEVFVKTLCKLINKTKKSVSEIDDSIFMNVNGIKEVNIKIGSYELRIAIINNIYELEYLIKSKRFDKFHYIEVKMCNNSCLEGNGFYIENEEKKMELKEKIYKSVNNYPFDDKNVKEFYKIDFSKPLSQKSMDLLHKKYEDKSNNLTNF